LLPDPFGEGHGGKGLPWEPSDGNCFSCAGQDKGTERAENSGHMPVQKYARGGKCVMSPTFQQRVADTFPPQFP